MSSTNQQADLPIEEYSLEYAEQKGFAILHVTHAIYDEKGNLISPERREFYPTVQHYRQDHGE
jgi:hypothetical protein